MSSERAKVMRTGMDRRQWLKATTAGTLGTQACISSGELKLPMEFTPERRAGDWPIASADEVELREEGLRAAYSVAFSPDELPNIRSLLVARRGQLVAEGYMADRDDAHRLRALMSATKCVTSLACGIALDRGELGSLETTLGEVVEEARGHRYGDITLRDLLTMRSGIAFSNEDFSLDMDWGGHESSIRRILSMPKRAEPGEVFDYTDATVHLAGAMVQRATGRTLSSYAKEHIFEPLGITQHHWLAHDDGLNYGAYGLFLTPRDFLRFGQGTLQAWQGDAGVVSQSYLREATSFQVEPDFGEGFDYGYCFWLTPRGDGFTPWGHGGQLALVLPEDELVVVVTADANSGDVADVGARDTLAMAEMVLEGAP